MKKDPAYKIYFRAGVVPMQRAMLSGNRVADAGKMAQAMGTAHNRTEITIYTDEMHDEIMWGNFIKAYVDTAIEKDEFVSPASSEEKIRILGSNRVLQVGKEVVSFAREDDEWISLQGVENADLSLTVFFSARIRKRNDYKVSLVPVDKDGNEVMARPKSIPIAFNEWWAIITYTLSPIPLILLSFIS